MRNKLCAGSIALLLVVIALLFIFPGTSVFAGSKGAISSILTAPVVTPTPDPSAALNAANNAISRAQDLLNIISVSGTILGVVLTLFSLLAALLTVLGFRSYRDVLSLAKDLRKNMEEIREDADKTRSALVYLGLGDRLLSQKNTEEALENYKKAGSLLPKDAKLQYMLGRIYSGAGDYDAAIYALESSSSPDDVSQGNVEKELGLAYRRRGKALNQEADYDTAVLHLKKAVILNSSDSDAQAILGGLYRRKGEYSLAYTHYERAWKLNPGSSYALGNLASLARYEGKLDEARMYFGFAEVVAIDHIRKGQGEIYWDYYDLALAQLALGKIAEAQKTYVIAIKETPGEAQFDGVLDNLSLLQKAPQPIAGLDDVVKMIKAAANLP